jgi:hypothetical protein
MSDNEYCIMTMPQSTAALPFSLEGTPAPNNHTMKARLCSFQTLDFLNMVRQEKALSGHDADHSPPSNAKVEND